jgi:hypothetical protein
MKPEGGQDVGKGIEMLKRWQAQQPSLGAELKAMTREAVKDIRGTLHQIFFGQPEHMAEAGTPLNPTQQIVTEGLKDREVHPVKDQLMPAKQREMER